MSGSAESRDPLDVLAVDGGDGTVLASGDVFVTDVALRARLASIAHVVDMEGYGVVYACRRLGAAVRRRLERHLLADRRGHAVHEVRPCECRVHLLYDRLVEPADPLTGRRPEWDAEGLVLPLEPCGTDAQHRPPG